MSKDPNTNAPPKGAPQESLEDAIYRSSLAEGNSGVRKASPMVTIPITILSYVAAAGFLVVLAKSSERVQKVIKKTTGIDLTEEQKEDDAPPPPPPPPAPAAPIVAPRVAAVRNDAPPPPPPDPSKDIVPEIAPRELPKQDLSLRYAVSSGSAGAGVPGGGVAGATAGGSGMAVAGSSVTKVVDFDFSQIKVKYQPPAPPYPPLAKLAKIQGTVVVEITVGVDGVPVKATALDGPPQLRPTAEQYAMNWRFEPALLNGVPQTARFKLTMPFRLR